MKSVGGAGLVVIGFLFLYMAISGKLDCFFTFVSCVTGANNPATATNANGSSGTTGNGINWGSVVNTGISIYNGASGSSPSASPFGSAPSIHT